MAAPRLAPNSGLAAAANTGSLLARQRRRPRAHLLRPELAAQITDYSKYSWLSLVVFGSLQMMLAALRWLQRRDVC